MQRILVPRVHPVVWALLFVVYLMASGQAGPLITFDGLKNDEAIDGYYDGGSGSLGSGPGPSLGLVFEGAVVRIANSAGGTGNFEGEPSPPAAAFSMGIIGLESRTTVGGLSLSYANPSGATDIRAYSNPGLSGKIVFDILLPPTPTGANGLPSFMANQIVFSDAARSVGIVSRGPNGFYLDDVLVEFAPAAVPDVCSLGLTLTGVCVIALRYRLRAGSKPPADLP